MKNTGKAKPDSVKSGGGEGKYTYPQYTTVYEIIRKHTVNDPISMTEVACQAGTYERYVRFAVERLRRAGIKVLSSTGDPSGYWLASDSDDFEGFVIRRAGAISRAGDLLAKMLQPGLPFDEPQAADFIDYGGRDDKEN